MPKVNYLGRPPLEELAMQHAFITEGGTLRNQKTFALTAPLEREMYRRFKPDRAKEAVKQANESYRMVFPLPKDPWPDTNTGHKHIGLQIQQLPKTFTWPSP